MKTAILLTLISSAAAFVAPSTRSVGSALSASFADEAGVLLPTGYFDPLRLATTQEKFDQYRAAEVKHGRVAMLAVVGYVVPEFYRWGGDIAPGLAFKDIPNGIAAIEAVPFLGWAQIFFLVGAVDYVRVCLIVAFDMCCLIECICISPFVSLISLLVYSQYHTARHLPIRHWQARLGPGSVENPRNPRIAKRTHRHVGLFGIDPPRRPKHGRTRL
jgi:Chlorophyll A-B binding protein